MSLTPFRDVNAALILAYKSCGLNLPTSYPLKDFPKDVDGAVAEVSILTADRYALTMGDEGMDRVLGILQVNIHIPENTGITQLYSCLDLITGFFTAGSSYTYNGQVVRQHKPARPSPIGESGKIAGNVQSVSIPWMSDVKRNLGIQQVADGTDPTDYAEIFEESL